MSKYTTAVAVLVFVLLSAVTGYHIIQNEEIAEYYQQSQEWCDERDGDLVNNRVIGDAGGLYCQLPGGESVPMDRVAETDFKADGPDDVASGQEHFLSNYLGGILLTVMAVVIILAFSLSREVNDGDD